MIGQKLADDTTGHIHKSKAMDLLIDVADPFVLTVLEMKVVGRTRVGQPVW